jgi:hypothetical protein
MALQNHPALYTGGNVTIDQRPHVALYNQLMQRKQARDDAFDEYIRSLNKNINSAGMRNQEREVFDTKLADWQKFGMENKDAIRRRQGGADIEFQKRYQDILNTVQESKTEEEKKKPFVEIWLDPAKRDRINEEEALNSIQQHDAPLYRKNKDGVWERNPDRRSLDYERIAYNPKPFEQDKYFKQFEDVKKMDLPPVVTKDPKTMTQTSVTTSIFDKEAKDIVATRAVTDYVQNKSFKQVIDGLDPKEYNDFFKKNYGHDIQTQADLAAAYTLKGLQQRSVKSEVKDDVYARQRAMEAIRQANRKALVRLRDSLEEDDVAGNNLWVDRYIATTTEEAKQNPNKRIVAIGGKRLVEDNIAVDPTLSKALERNGQSPEYITVTKDGQIRPLYLKYVEDPKTKEIKIATNSKGEKVWDETISVPISQEQVKLALGKRAAGVSQTNKEMTGQSTPPSKSTKQTKSVKIQGDLDDIE